MNCERPDRDVPRMKCGYPIPCPYHTVVVDVTMEPTTITEPVTADVGALARARVRQIAAVVKPLPLPLPPTRKRTAKKRKAKR